MSLIRDAYLGSDGQLTLRACDALMHSGPNGEFAVLLFRAMKASSRAKKYRGRHETGESYRDMAYERKGQTLAALCEFLDGCDGEFWGWGLDDKESVNRHVLYIDLPEGQVSFHSPRRFPGPDYRGGWDGVRGVSEDRIIRYCEAVLAEPERLVR